MAARTFEYTDKTSSKFWEVSAKGSTVTVRYGKIGTTGQTTVKACASPAQAKVHIATVVREKAKKGYKERAAVVTKRKAATKSVGKKDIGLRAKATSYGLLLRGGVRRTTIGALDSQICRALSKCKSDEDEDLRVIVEDLDDELFTYGVTAEAFQITVTESGKPNVVFSSNQDDKTLKRDIREFYVKKAGLYVTTTQSERGQYGVFSLTIPAGDNFDPSLLVVVGVWPKDTAAGPLISEIHYSGVSLPYDENHETDVRDFQIDYFEVKSMKNAGFTRTDLTQTRAIDRFKN